MSLFDRLFSETAGCRGHGEALLTNDRAFPLPGDKPQYPRDRVVDIQHVRLDIALDLDNKKINGSVSHTFTPLNDGLTTLELDAVELQVHGVRDSSGSLLKHDLSGGRLSINFESAPSAGNEETVIV